MAAPEVFKELDDLTTHFFGLAPLKEDREKIHKGMLTDQVDDTSLASSIFLYHNPKKDKTLASLGMKARVSFRTKDPRSEILEHYPAEQALIETFNSLIGSDPIEFDHSMFEDRCVRSMANLLSKDASLNISKVWKTYYSTPENYTEFAIKRQPIKKIGKIFSKAKDPQVLAEHVYRVSLEMAPIWMYIMYKTQELLDSRGHKIHLHPGHSTQDLIDFVKTNVDFSRLSREDDATGWDSKVNAPCVSFGEYLLLRFGFSQADFERYKFYKDYMESTRGPIAFMMFSGGPDTLPFNTLLSMTIQHLKYEIKKGTAQTYGGDDVFINDTPPVRPGWHLLEGTHIIQVFKTKDLRYPTAFGWRYFHEPHKDPEITLARLLYAEAKGKTFDVILDIAADATTLAKPSVMMSLEPHQQELVTFLFKRVNHYMKAARKPRQGKTFSRKAGGERDYDMKSIDIMLDSLF